jgi:nucleoid-associated protein YgaU
MSAWKGGSKMPRKAKRKTTIKTVKPVSNKTQGFLSQIKWGESYTSLFLGAAVVVVAFVLIFSFFKSINLMKKQTTSTSTVVTKEVKNVMPKTYVVKSGDYLWSIAEKVYGSGYNWVDIANANKLQNPSVLFAGKELVIPNVEPRTLTVQNSQVTVPNPITGSTYTVVKGDYLWNIAVRAYGDGYKWTVIAQANKLANPGLIFSGNVLQLPR